MRLAPSLRRRIAALAAVLLASGCSHRAHAPIARPLVLPKGIVTSAPLVEGRAYGGLYPGHEGDAGVWTAERASFSLRKTRRATRLALVFYIPGSSGAQRRWYAAHPVALDLRVGDGPVHHRCCFRGGIASAHVEIPEKLRDERGEVPIQLLVHGAVVPRDIDPALADSRRLGIILLRTFFY